MSEVFHLTGKNVILTGAAGSVGTQIAILFAKAGANLLLSDVSIKALETLRQNVELHGPHSGRIECKACDVSIEADVEALVQHLDQYGGVDVMLNNAGVFPHEDGDAVEVTQKAWDLTYQVNIKGTWYGCKHAVLIGLIGSATAQLAYTTSKGAIIAMTRELAIVHAREGFRFNALCPGPLNTPLMQDYLGTNVERRARREIHLPQGRFGEPIEQANAALFLASDASSFFNAQELVVDGGLTKV
ncbi:putative cyclopentanol dehydrogenase [Colletotrichum sublineola]|uniref:Putative cyclopentanol dehydrogenase n=1 Tax=Colletotrichum sublineola TaxID=1173701 RepID=A0A066X5J4_COLSU|nr:putative cyclopentanol dehydrogenase [Colletotrichum sublineola]